MKMKIFESEVELCKKVIEYLKIFHWDIYQDVQTPFGQIVDIIATQGRILWSIRKWINSNIVKNLTIDKGKIFLNE